MTLVVTITHWASRRFVRVLISILVDRSSLRHRCSLTMFNDPVLQFRCNRSDEQATAFHLKVNRSMRASPKDHDLLEHFRYRSDRRHYSASRASRASTHSNRSFILGTAVFSIPISGFVREAWNTIMWNGTHNPSRKSNRS